MRRLLFVAALLAASGVSAASAQNTRIIVRGNVRTANTDVPLGGAVVELSRGGLTFRTRSDERGEFNLRDVPVGQYALNVMRLGYLPYRDSLGIGDVMGRLKVILTSNVQELQAIAVRANVTAVYGGIGVASRRANASGERALYTAPGATVQVLGSGRTVTTDTGGKFFLELNKPGNYIVRVSAPGLKDDLFPVVVPKNTAVDASRLLDSADTRPATGYDAMVKEMDRRLRVRGPNSALISGEEIRESRMNIVEALVRSKGMVMRGMQIGSSTCVFIDGIPRPNLSIEAIRSEEVAAVELYAPNGETSGTVAMAWPKGAPCGTNNRRSPVESATIPVAQFALVWTVP